MRAFGQASIGTGKIANGGCMTHGSHRGRAACATTADRAAGLLRRAGAATGAASGRLPMMELVRAAIPLTHSLPLLAVTLRRKAEHKTNRGLAAPHPKRNQGSNQGSLSRLLGRYRLLLSSPATCRRTGDGGSSDGEQRAGGAAGGEAQLCTGESRVPVLFPPALALLGSVTLLQACACGLLSL